MNKNSTKYIQGISVSLFTLAKKTELKHSLKINNVEN